MKLCILLFAFLGVATAAALPAGKVHSRTTRSLSDDLDDFAALIDIDAALEIVIVYLAEDAQVQAAVEYILSPDFAGLVQAVQQIPEYIAFLDYLQSNGLDVYKWVNALNELLGLSELSYSRSASIKTRISGGIAGLFYDLLALVDLEAARALYEEKLETSEDFAALVALLGSSDAQAVYAALKANEEYQVIRAKLVALGLDIEVVLDKLRELVGLSTYSISKRSVRVTRDLQADWQDFLALVPVDEILEIVIIYLAEDAEVQAAFEYLVSEDFATLVVAVQEIPEYIAFLNYLQSNGLDVYQYVNLINELLGLPTLSYASSTSTRSARVTGGLAGLVADILAVLPRDELRALFEEKLETSEEFANLVALFTSSDAQELYDALKANEEYQHIRETLVAAGVDVDAILDVAKGLIGWA